MKTNFQTGEVDFPMVKIPLLSSQRSYFKIPTNANLGKIGLYLWINRLWISGVVQQDPVFLPREIIPNPNDPEILPNPHLPEEEEYLPDEDENPIEDPRREIDDPYQPDREQDFPPEREKEWPQEEPGRT
ncbi:hypothetical protein J2X69_000172 [Algoriphagus sp. 4150]|uniref:hypothetical protein n=1 Tax=Algoriphagus sp. 4150 TaxID=2817756 RepID=UPI0028629BE6|nr:hypothetical protein [Algoriphagus sp. 4150]MDR7127844.1 hypothetical protein [Algoriphagus sp. 4150]